MKGISIIICCYNSGWIIQRTLEALKSQILDTPIPYEVVLVDNNCQDNTVEVAEKTMKNSAIEFRIVKEANPGLANARRKGINEIKYDYVIYCDDDNLLCPDYVTKVVRILDSKPKVAAVGGKGIAEFQTEPPSIIKKNLECYAIGSQLNHKNWLFGAGLALRTALVREVYDNQKCYLMGRKGKKLLSGDDSELVMSMVLRGYEIYPTDEITFIHVLKVERLTKEYFMKFKKGLLLPSPVIGVFNAVIYNRPFSTILDDYCNSIKGILGSFIHNQRNGAVESCKAYMRIIYRYHYWGIFRLWRIYFEWKQIKRSFS